MKIQATKHKNILINIIWVAKGPVIFEIYNFLFIPIDEQTDSFLQNDNAGHQNTTYNN